MNEMYVFKAKSDWGHFRNPTMNVSKHTYYLPPKTTISGLLAGILGLERDSYYELFSSDSFSVSVQIQGELARFEMPKVIKKTSDTSMEWVNSRGGGPKIGLVTNDNVRRVFSYIKDPEYKFFVHHSDDSILEELRDRIATSRYQYTPTLGSSECIAKLDSLGFTSVEEITSGTHNVKGVIKNQSSICSDLENRNIASEKAVLNFKRKKTTSGRQHRIPNSYIQYFFPTDGEDIKIDANKEEDLFWTEHGCISTY